MRRLSFRIFTNFPVDIGSALYLLRYRPPGAIVPLSYYPRRQCND